jgi:hypothetical protein
VTPFCSGGVLGAHRKRVSDEDGDPAVEVVGGRGAPTGGGLLPMLLRLRMSMGQLKAWLDWRKMAGTRCSSRKGVMAE